MCLHYYIYASNLHKNLLTTHSQFHINLININIYKSKLPKLTNIVALNGTKNIDIKLYYDNIQTLEQKIRFQHSKKHFF